MSPRVVRVDDGILRIEQRVRVRGRDTGADVSGPACIYARVRVTRGTVAYLTGRTRVAAPDHFELFLPPFAVVQAALERCDVTTLAMAFEGGPGLPPEPVLFSTGDEPAVLCHDDLVRRISAATDVTRISRAPDPGPLAAGAKAIIDAEYGTPLEIGRIARRLRTSPAVLSRSFRNTYGMPPVRYRHHVRIMDALVRFAGGAVPAEVFQDVGFDDLSRFYRIFRKVACAAPGTYRPARSRIAKT